MDALNVLRKIKGYDTSKASTPVFNWVQAKDKSSMGIGTMQQDFMRQRWVKYLRRGGGDLLPGFSDVLFQLICIPKPIHCHQLTM